MHVWSWGKFAHFKSRLSAGEGRFGVCFVVRGKEGVCNILSKKMWAVEDVYGLLSFHIYKDIK